MIIFLLVIFIVFFFKGISGKLKFKKQTKLVRCLTESQFKKLQNVIAGWLDPISRKKMRIQEREKAGANNRSKVLGNGRILGSQALVKRLVLGGSSNISSLSWEGIQKRRLQRQGHGKN